MLPLGGVTLSELDELDQGAEAELPEVVPIAMDEGKNLLAQGVRNLFLSEQLASGGDMIDPKRNRLAVMKAEVEIEATRHQRLEVGDVLVAAHVHILLEVEVRDEDEGTLELIALRNVIFLERRRLLHPVNPTSRGGIAEGLENVQGVLILEDAVSVIQDHDIARAPERVAELIEVDRRQRALHDLELSVRRGGEHVLDSVRLADARSASHDERADVASECGLGELAQHAEAVLEVRKHLTIRATGLRLNLHPGGDFGVARATTLLDLQRHLFSW